MASVDLGTMIILEDFKEGVTENSLCFEQVDLGHSVRVCGCAPAASRGHRECRQTQAGFEGSALRTWWWIAWEECCGKRLKTVPEWPTHFRIQWKTAIS